MNFPAFENWLSRRIAVKSRLKKVCLCLVIYLMIEARKHSLEGAARFWGMSTSQFSRFLSTHSIIAVYTLDDLSKRQAKQLSKVLKWLEKGSLPWKIAILIDSTIQHRSSLHTDNAKRFNHGKGFVIGHQWTNIVLIINGVIIPLPPIAFHTKKYCRENKLEYKTENAMVIEYINNLELADYIGNHNSKEVVVLADSGYDDKRIENAIANKKWKFIIALNKTRSVKSERENANTPKSQGWTRIAEFFKNHRGIKWQTVRIPTNSSKRKRMEFRIRQIIGYLRHVGRVQLICSEFKKRRNGRRKYLACNDLRVKPRQILIGYRLRWRIEIFHKEVKMFLGFEDVATTTFKSVTSYVHWVYCAYILLHSHPPGLPEHTTSLAAKQRKIKEIIESKEKARVIQLLTQINGGQRYKNELQTALQHA